MRGTGEGGQVRGDRWGQRDRCGGHTIPCSLSVSPTLLKCSPEGGGVDAPILPLLMYVRMHIC